MFVLAPTDKASNNVVVVLKTHYINTQKQELSAKAKTSEYDTVHEISNNEVFATSKASDQPAHTRSLIRAFARRLNIL